MKRMCNTVVVVTLSEVELYIREEKKLHESHLNTFYAPHANGCAFVSDPVRAELVYNHTLRGIKALLGTTEKRSRFSKQRQVIVTRDVLVPIPGVYSNTEFKLAFRRAVRLVGALDGRIKRAPGERRFTAFGFALWFGTKKHFACATPQLAKILACLHTAVTEVTRRAHADELLAEALRRRAGLARHSSANWLFPATLALARAEAAE